MDPTKHNYFRKIAELIAAGLVPPALLSEVTILHDDWCRIYTGGYCNCNPEIQLPVRQLYVPPAWS